MTTTVPAIRTSGPSAFRSPLGTVSDPTIHQKPPHPLPPPASNQRPFLQPVQPLPGTQTRTSPNAEASKSKTPVVHLYPLRHTTIILSTPAHRRLPSTAASAFLSSMQKIKSSSMSSAINLSLPTRAMKNNYEKSSSIR